MYLHKFMCHFVRTKYERKEIMRTLCLPSKQIFKHLRTGKFKAPSANWKHESFLLEFDYELFVMTEGTLYLSYNQERFTVNAGEYLLLPPIKNSWRKGFKQAYCSFYWLHFITEPGNIPAAMPSADDKIFMELDADSYFTLPQTGKIPKLEKLVVLMKQLQDLEKNQYPAIAMDSLATSVITELYGQLSLNSPIDASHNQKQVYLDIMDYVKLHNNRNIRISEIADHFGYNEKYLSHLFAKLTGIPLKQYILNQKIDAANYMLTDTNKPISNIAKDLGYPDVHNFSRMYKKITGLTPTEYRNAYAKRLLYNV